MQSLSESLKRPARFGYRAVYCIACTMAAATALTGCGNVIYTYRASSVTAKLEEARQAGAEQSATYEYTLAQEHLRKAMTEAAEADYGDAIELSGLADDYAQRAIDKAKHRVAKSAEATSTSTESSSTGTAATHSLKVGEPQ